MALKIIEQKGVFVTEGSINSSTSGLFQNNLNNIMDFIKKATINIDKVKYIDIRIEIVNNLNQINLSVLNNRNEIKEVHYSNPKTSPYSIHDELINIDDHVII